MSFQETFDINYDYYDYYCKSVNIIFLLYLKCYQSFKNYLTGKLNKTCLVNICFAYSSRTVFWDLSFCFCLKVHNLDDTFTLIRKKILCYVPVLCFVVWILWPELRIYWQGVWFFDKFEISFMSQF